MNKGLLILVFDDVMLSSSLDAQHITIQSTTASTAVSHKLTSGRSRSTRGYTQEVLLSASDLNAVKKLRTLAVDQSSSFISFAANLGTDVAGQVLIAIVDTSAKQVRTFTEDTSSPQLTSWSVNVSSGELTLNFNETVDLRTFDAKAITIQNTATSANQTVSRTLVGGSASESDSATSFKVSLLPADLNFLKQNTSIATTLSNSYLSITSALITDMNARLVLAIPDTSALQASAHDRDVTHPILVSAELDLSRSTLSLVFNEVINASTVDVTLITIQNAVAVPSTGASHTLTGGSVSTDSSTNIVVTLIESDLNSLKVNTSLATSRANTFVSLSANAAEDMESNAIQSSSTAVDATFVADSVAPTLRNFDLDMGQGRLVMSFSESVDTTSFDFSQIKIQSQKGAGGVSVSISGATVFQSSTLRNVVTLALSGAVLDELKKDVLIATTRLNTFVSLSSSALKDQAGNDVEAVLATNAKDVGTLTPDGVAPTLQTYSLDMDGSGQLLLTFSEAVQGSTLNSSLITLVGTGTQYTLTGGSTTSGNSPTIIVDLTAADLNAIKKNTALATSSSTTSLLFSRDLIRDMAGNVINALTTGTSPVQFTADTTEPTLTSYSVSLAGTPAALQLTMTFSEVVNSSTFDLSQITLISTSSTQASTKSVALSLNTATRSQASSTILTVEILAGDLTRIRANRPLFEFRNTSFLNLTSVGVLDMSGQQLTTVAFKQAAAHTADLTRPKLSAFSLDMNAQELLLTFDENIVVSSLNASHIKLQNAKSSPTASLDLSVSSSGQTIATSGRVIRISLTTSDFNSLSLRTALATSRANTFLSLGPQSIQDTVQNYADEVVTTNAQQATGFTADVSQPSLTNWTIDVSSGLITLTFSEAVRASSLSADELTIHSDASATPLSSYKLTGAANASTVDGTILSFSLTFADANALQALPSLAVNSTTAFLALGTDAVQDMYGNLVQRILASQAIAASVYTPDSFLPALLSWEINLSTGTLVVSFNETIDRSSLGFAVFEIQDGATKVTNSYALKNTVATGLDSASYSVTIDPADSDQIKQLGLCSSRANCFAVFTASFARDIAGFSVFARSDGSALQAVNVTNDASGPGISAFAEFDLVKGELKISFSEIVNASSFNPRAITLQTLFANPLSSYTLTGGNSTVADGTTMTLTLSTTDIDKIQETENLCTHRGTCYLTATDALITDLAGNKNRPQAQGFPGLIVQTFKSDVSRPTLTNFQLDLDSNRLVLTFSEPVRSSRLLTSQITLQSATQSAKGQLEYTLTGGTLPTADGLTVVNISLSTADANELKRRSFATSTSDTFLRMTSTTATDMSIFPNSIVAINDGQAKAAAAVTTDVTAPVLSAFTLSVDTDELTMTFNEPVNWAVLNAKQLTLSSSNGTSPVTVPLTGGTPSTQAAATSATISLVAADIRAIKLASALGTTTSNTFLSFPSGTIQDVSGNNNTAVSNKQAASVTTDATRAQLESFAIDVEQGRLNLTFTDVVNASTFDASAITIQSSLSASPGQFASLSSTSTTKSANGYVIVVDLSAQDLLAIKSTPSAARSQVSTFLRMSASAIDDVDGRDVLAITDGKALTASAYTGDISQPTVTDFEVDMSKQALIITFSEPVNQSSFRPTSLTLEGARPSVAGTEKLPLTGGTVSRSTNGLTITLTLSTADLNSLNAFRSLYTATNDSFLALQADAVRDLFANQLAAVSSPSTIQASKFVSESIGPSLVNFTFDANSGHLLLTFDESVSARTLNTSYFTFQTTSDSTRLAQETYRLTGGSFSNTSDGTVINVTLTTTDLNGIKAIVPLAKAQASTFLSMVSGGVQDTFGNPSRAVASTRALQTASYTVDTTKPRLVSFAVNVSSSVMTFTFSETVDAAKFDPTKITVQDDASTPTRSYSLTGGAATSVPSTIITLTLSKDDIDALARLDSLLTSRNSSYVALASALIQDMAGELLDPGTPHRADSFDRDNVVPLFRSFDLDMNRGLLTMTFSEVVQLSSLQASLGHLRTRSGDRIESLTGSSPVVGATNNLSFTLDLTTTIVNNLKLEPLIAVSRETTHLNLSAGFVSDVFSNPSPALPSVEIVTTFTPDTTRVKLTSYTMDGASGVISLTFSEPVDVSTLNVSGMIVQNNQTHLVPNGFYRLTDTTRSTSPNGLIVAVDISSADFNAIRDLTTLATTTQNTFLSLSADTITDMAGNKLDVVLSSSAQAVSEFTRDAVVPRVQNFSLNLNSGVLEVTFSETVDLDTVEITKLSLQNQSAKGTGTESVTLTTRSNATRPSLTVIRIDLDSSDLDNIKAQRNLATSQASTFLAVDQDFVKDLAGNSVQTVAVGDGVFTSDITAPILLSWDLDIDSGIFVLSFSETIDVPAMQTTAFTLQDDELRLASSYALRTTARPGSDSRALNLTLSKIDFDAVLRQNVCFNSSNCYLTFSRGAVRDHSGNVIEAIADGSAVGVTNFTPDVTGPSLVAFTRFDLNTGVMQLSFSEPVRLSTADSKVISLHNWHGGSSLTTNFSLTGGQITSTDSLTLSLNIIAADLNTIKADTVLCVARQSCWVRFPTSFVEDMAGNAVKAVVISQTFEPSQFAGVFIFDTTSPELSSFELDMDSTELTLTFDETIDISETDTASLVVQNALSRTTSYQLTLNSRVTSTADSTVMRILLSNSDSIQIKSDLALATNAATTFLTFSSSFVKDMYGNAVVQLVDAVNATGAKSFQEDKISPIMSEFTLLDMNSETLQLSFNEPMLSTVASVNFTLITLQSNQTSVSISRTLIGGSAIVPQVDRTRIEFKLNAEDVRQLKLQAGLAVSTATSFVSLAAGAFQDVNKNPSVAVLSTNATQAVTFIPDTTPPDLSSFALDMQDGRLSLTFNDVMNTSSLDVTQLTLQSNAVGSDTANTFSLTTSSSSSNNGYTIVIDLSTADLNAIKARSGLATQLANTFISAAADTILDMANVNMIAITSRQGRVASNYTKDVTSPNITSFTFNVSTGVLSITMSETINTSSVNVREITLQNSADGTGRRRTLTGGVVAPLTPATTFSITLNVPDLNEIKKFTDFGTTTANTFLSATAAALSDMDANKLTVIPASRALQASTHTADTIAPVLEYFELDMNTAQLIVTFSETVNATSVDLTKFVLLPSATAATTTGFRLTGGESSTQDSHEIRVNLTTVDLNSIKANRVLATSGSNTFLRLDALALLDNIDLALQAMTSGRRADKFTADKTRPQLLLYDVDLSQGTVFLSFDEVVDALTLNTTEITFQAQSSDRGSFYTLTGGSTTSQQAQSFTVNLTTADLNSMKLLSDLLTAKSNTFLRLSSSAISDMQGLAVQEILKSNALNVRTFTTDATKPSVTGFEINMTSNELIVSFSEVVRASTLKVTAFTLQDKLASPTSSVRLTTAVVSSTDSSVLTLTLSTADLESIHKSLTLGVDQASVFLTVDQAAVNDTTNNELVARTAIAPREFTADSRAPTLESYNLRMADNTVLQIVLSFSEVVDITTLNVNQFSFRASPSHAFYRLTGGSFDTSANTSRVVVNATATDLTNLRDSPPVASNDTTSLLTFPSGAVKDMAGNSIIAVDDVRVTTYTADLTPPELSSFSLDLNTDELRLTFSEPILVNTLEVTRITLQASANVAQSSLDSYDITLGSVFAVVTDNKQAIVKLNRADLNVIKQRTQLAVDRATTFISLPTRAVVLDLAENRASIIVRTAALQATSHAADTVRPQLESFDLNIATTTMTLRFSETMNIRSFSPAGSVAFQSNANGVGAQTYTLTGGVLTSTVNSSTVTFTLLEKDHNELLTRQQLAISQRTTFISITGSLLQDMNSNDVVRISTTSALQVSQFTNDTDRPRLVSSSLNLNTLLLTLSFTETVDASTFTPAEIVLQDNSTKTVSSYQLTTSTVQTTNGAELTVTLSTADANAIKADTQLCTSTSNCYILFSARLVRDMSSLDVRPIVDGNATEVTVTTDARAPRLISFVSINLITGQMVLSFDETVDVSTLDATKITLQSFFEQPLSSVALTGGTVVGGDAANVTLQLSDNDLTVLRADTDVCVSRTSCYVIAGAGLVRDTNNVTNTAVVSGAPGLVVGTYTKDTTPPTLSDFDLDLNGTGTLTLHFSEPVSRSSLQTTLLTLQDAARATLSHRLTGGAVTALNSSTLQVALTAGDLSAIKAASFASNSSNTFLAADAGAVTDTSSNGISAIPDGSAIGVNQYSADSSPPTLQDFRLDLTTHKLSLTFSEPIDPATVKTNLFSLLSSNDTATAAKFTFTTGTTVDTTVASSTIVMSISAADIASIKRNSALATTSANTYVSLLADAVRDAAGQSIGAVSPTLSKQAFAGDTTRAQLSGFSIDMHQSIVRLTFTDLVRASSLDASAITVQDAKTATAGKAISLSKTSTTSSSDGYVLVVNIAAADLLRIKTVKGLATSQATTWMTLGAHAVDDLNALDVLAVTDGNAIQANPFVGDTVAVDLLSFTLDMDGTPVLSMTFTDTIDLATLQLTSITVQSTNISSAQSVTLSGGTTALSSDGTSVNVTLLAGDSDKLKLNTALATSLASTFLSLPSGSVKDLAGNDLTAVDNSSATQASSFTPDTTSPEVVSWKLDVNAGQITLSFNEVVQASSFSGVGLSLQPHSSNVPSTERFALTGKASSTTTDGTTLVLNLTVSDLNSIKAIGSLATSEQSSFLVATSASVKDLNNRNLSPIPNTAALALPTADFTADSTSPSLTTFSVDMDAGLIELTFDEVIRSSSVDPQEVTLIAGAGSSVLFKLTGGTVSTTDSTNINITLSESNLNSVKLLTGLYTAKSTAFISFTSDAFTDMQGLSIGEVNTASARETFVFVADTTAPVLSSWTLDMDAESHLVMSFTEVVNASSLTVARIAVRSAKSPTSGTARVLTTSSTVSVDGLSVLVNFSAVDSNAIKSNDGLAVSSATSYLIFTTKGAIADMIGNQAEVMSEGQQVSSYTADTTPPIFETFTLDVDTGKLSLTFDESVRTGSFAFDKIQLKGTRTTSLTSETVDLRPGVSTSLSPNVTIIEINLGVMLSSTS